MSHTITVKDLKMPDLDILTAACDRLGLGAPRHGTHSVYSAKHTGHAVNLPEWRYPVVVDDGGTIRYDNYNGSWGSQNELDKLKQAYGVEAGHKIARDQRLRVVAEEVLTDGSVKLQCREI